MKCENCGTEFDRGAFCPNCGTKCNEEVARIKSDKPIHNKRDTKGEKGAKQPENIEKMPWYFSGWFIIIISILTFWIFWIPGIILAMIRLLKYKEKRKSSLVLTLLLGIPCGALIFSFVSDMISASETEKQLKAYIESGQYVEAQELIDQEYSVGTLSYVEKMADLYELQGMYDEAVSLWLEYCNNEYEPIDIPDFRIDELNGYVEKYRNELQSETIEKIQNLITDRELAKEEEQETKEAKETEKKEKVMVESTVESTVKQTIEPIKEPEQTPIPESTEKPTTEEDDESLKVGDSYNLYDTETDEHVATVSILDIGHIDTDIIYVSTEIENLSVDTNLDVVGNLDTLDLVINGYQESSQVLISDMTRYDFIDSGRISLKPGRKTKFTFGVSLPEDVDYNTADVELYVFYSSLPIIFCENGVWIDDEDTYRDPRLDLDKNYVYQAYPVLIDYIPGEYIIAGGGNNGTFTVTEDGKASLEMYDEEINFSNKEMVRTENSNYKISLDGNQYLYITFFEDYNYPDTKWLYIYPITNKEWYVEGIWFE